MADQHFDVLIVGAGISGIGAGYHLQAECPGKSYVILEGRRDIGGTWDLFRYPGIRSDSDMFTLGYSFHPWKAARSIADGPAILEYLRETANEFGIDKHFRFNHRVKTATWSSEDSAWTVDAEVGDEKQPVRYTCNFLYLCSGYYDYESGYAPAFEGCQDFQGQIIHPQHWPKDLDYRNKRIVVIGSGATAVTLVPAMAETAAHVTMLQRSPSYIVSLPSVDRIARFVRWLLPERAAHRALRWKNVLLGIYFYQFCRRAPGLAKKLLRRGLARELPPDFDIDTHFKPRYQPWDQRVCLVPNADLFQAIRAGRVSVVTDQIERFTKEGIRLKSGKELPADIIVTATGLKMLPCGGIRLSVDGTPVEPGQRMTYKGLMLSDVPNCAMCVGYTTASWTLRADLSSAYLCRLLNYMDRHGYKQCVPHPNDPELRPEPLLGLTSGYVQRGSALFPKQGSKSPWVLRQNYIRDLMMMRFGAVDDGAMVFSTGGNSITTGPAPQASATDAPVAAASA
ncbi:MAG TPA: NAD(P)/FAD-dependent oxidoreductase [Planctomycetaceae bacterium]|nr:NAD(P)/FAD-dependent oxidoreductase [Planctomycetaceae bacterium]